MLVAVDEMELNFYRVDLVAAKIPPCVASHKALNGTRISKHMSQLDS